jgi:hypothetical protein
MDPTKSFDHLDPKLKETYARVMGTSTSGSGTQAPAQDSTASVTPPAGGLSASPFASPSPTQPAADPAAQTQFGSVPTPTPDASTGPNPGTGPTINTMPTDTQASFMPPATEPPSTAEQDQTSSPPNNSFFSNPTPAANPTSVTEANPVEPSIDPTPVTPYSPEGFGAAQSTSSPEQLAQPLPSPASVSQNAPHETSALLKVLYIVGSIIFFAVYTLFWIKIFGLPLPFPLPF